MSRRAGREVAAESITEETESSGFVQRWRPEEGVRPPALGLLRLPKTSEWDTEGNNGGGRGGQGDLG